MKKLLCLCVCSALLIGGAALCAGSPAGAGAAKAYPIGFRVLERADASRVSKTFPKGRPLQIGLWYPAAAAGTPLTYRDYLLLTTTETSFGAPREADAAQTLRLYREFLGQAGVPPARTDAWLSTKMRASRDAAPARGAFPLLLIAQGNDESAHDQAFLAESLAARGWVVATTPSQSKIGGPMRSEQDIPAAAEDQAADLACALREVRREAMVRPGRYGLAAHSFGARSALLLAMRDREAAALVSLDGGIGGKAGKGLLDKAKGFDRAAARLPILHVYQEGDRFMVPDLDLLRSLTDADRWLVRVDGLRHVHFSSTGILVRSVPEVAKATSADARTSAAWDAMADTTASFLDRFAGGAAAAPPARTRARWSPPASPLLHAEALPAEGAGKR